MPAERPRLVAQALLQLFALNQVSAWVPLGRPSRTFHAKATDACFAEVEELVIHRAGKVGRIPYVQSSGAWCMRRGARAQQRSSSAREARS